MDVFFSEKWQLWLQPRPQGSLKNKLGSSRSVRKRGEYLFNGKILILLIIVNLASAEGQRRSPGLGGLWDGIFIQTNQKGHLKINFDSEPGGKLEM